MTQKIWESGECRRCSECAGEDHHWLEDSIDPTEDDVVEQWLRDHRQFTRIHPDFTDELLLAHWECKHCPAIKEYDPEEDYE